jgi:hypothetical protein
MVSLRAGGIIGIKKKKDEFYVYVFVNNVLHRFGREFGKGSLGLTTKVQKIY